MCMGRSKSPEQPSWPKKTFVGPQRLTCGQKRAPCPPISCGLSLANARALQQPLSYYRPDGVVGWNNSACMQPVRVPMRKTKKRTMDERRIPVRVFNSHFCWLNSHFSCWKERAWCLNNSNLQPAGARSRREGKACRAQRKEGNKSALSLLAPAPLHGIIYIHIYYCWHW